VSRYREQLRAAVTASSAPYGYTITIWSSGAVSIRALGLPRFGSVLLFIAGAVAGFVLVELSAFGMLHIRPQGVDPRPRAFWASANLLPACLAVTAVWGVDRALPNGAAWPFAGLLATAGYLAVYAAQVTLATRT
jgi:hypothetical protein